MENDIEDIRKLDAVIKEEYDCNSFGDEFDEFITHTMSDDEEQLEYTDEDELIQIEDVISNIVDASDQKLYHNMENLNFSTDMNLVKHCLSLEEMKVISACKDFKLKQLLILNRAKHVQLQNIRYRLYELLKQCKLSLKIYEDKIEKFKIEDTLMSKSIIPKLGHPYFKTKHSYSCNPNADTMRKQRDKEICVDYLPHLFRWTLEDQVILKRSIIFNYTNDLVDKYESEIKNLNLAKKNANNERIVSIQKSIMEITDKITKLKEDENPDPPPLDSSIEINWISISKCDFASRHSPQACKAFWNIYLHPSINKSYWSDKENKEIRELAKEYNFQNWEDIAMKLRNNRSGFAVCVHYYTMLTDRFRRDRFDIEEDQFLVEVVNLCRIGNYIPWSKVSEYFQNRSRTQLYHRYKYNLEYASMKKGSFSYAEDCLIALLVRKFGKDFGRCSKYIPNRSSAQISHRYKNYIAFDEMDLGCWSLEDDEAIMNHVVANGEKAWSKLFPVVKAKNRTHIRLRYFHLRDWLQKNSNKQLADVPRRKKYKRCIDRKWIVKSCIEHFGNQIEIPTLSDIGEYLKPFGHLHSTMTQPLRYRVVNDNVDKELIQYFQSTCKIKTSKSISAQEVEHIVNIIKTLMSILDVELTVPDNVSLRNNPKIDALDLEVLSRLVTANNQLESKLEIAETRSNSTQIVKYSESNLISYLPPNINTLVGIRSLLLVHQSYKSKCLAKSTLNKIMSREMITMNTGTPTKGDEMQTWTLIEQKKYIKRFNAIFKWPALMSVMEPNENLIVSRPINKVGPALQKPQKPGRPKKNLIKIELMNKARMKNVMQSNSLGANIKESSLDDRTKNVEKCVDVVSKGSTSKTTAKTKRTNDCEINKQNIKKVRTGSDNSEIKELEDDIDKLDKLLILELNGKLLL